jgi:hypothetical protein
MAKERAIFAHSMRITFGLFLVVVGVFLYAKQMGLIDADFPIWAVVFVAFGAFIIAGELSKR